MRATILAWVVYLLYRTLKLTWRIEMIEPPSLRERLANREPVILAHWHGDELVLVQLFGIYPIGTIVSTSKDGEIMNRLIHIFGGSTTRGSSTRGGIGALKGLLKLVREGWNCSFAVDGPKGPIYKVKPGIFEVAKLLQIPIYWAGAGCDRAIHFPKSWNKTYLPKPFARVRIQWFGPMNPPSKEDDPRDPNLAKDLESKLNVAKQQVAAFIANPKA